MKINGYWLGGGLLTLSDWIAYDYMFATNRPASLVWEITVAIFTIIFFGLAFENTQSKSRGKE